MKIVKKHRGGGGMLPFIDYDREGSTYTVFPRDDEGPEWRYYIKPAEDDIDTIMTIRVDRQPGGGWNIRYPEGFEEIRFPSRRSALAGLKVLT